MRKLYWNLRLIGMKVDPAKGMIYRNPNNRLHVHEYGKPMPQFMTSGRLVLHMNVNGRIKSVSIT